MRAGLIFLCIMFTALATGAGHASTFHGVVIGKDGNIRQSRSALAVMALHEGRARLTFTFDYTGGDGATLYMVVPPSTRIVKENAPDWAMLSRLETFTAPSIIVKKDDDPCNPHDRRGVIVEPWIYWPGCAPENNDVYHAPVMLARAVDRAAETRIMDLTKAQATSGVHQAAVKAMAAHAGKGDKLLVIGKEAAVSENGFASFAPISIEYETDKYDFELEMEAASGSPMKPLDITLIVLSSTGRAIPANRKVRSLAEEMRILAVIKRDFAEYYEALFASFPQFSGAKTVFTEYYGIVIPSHCNKCVGSDDIAIAMGARWLDVNRNSSLFITRLHYMTRPADPPDPINIVEVYDGSDHGNAFRVKAPFQGPAAACTAGRDYVSRFIEDERKAASQVPPGMLPPDWEDDLRKSLEMTELFSAAATDDLEKVKRAVESGVDINIKGENQITLVSSAARGGAANVIRWLAEQGADLQAREYFNKTRDVYYSPLERAILSDKPEAIEAFFKAGLDIRKPNEHGYTPLMLAAEQGKAEAIKALLVLGSDINATNSNNQSAIDLALVNNNQASVKAETFRTLLENGAEVDLSGVSCGFGMLNRLVDLGNVDLLWIALERGKNFDPDSRQAWQALTGAVEKGDKPIAYLLLDRMKPAIMIMNGHPDERQIELWRKALGGGHLDVAELLLKRGVNPQDPDSPGNSPLAMACESGFKDLGRKMRDKGAADPNVSRDCVTLGMAVYDRDLHTAETLLVGGADPDNSSREHNPPLITAVGNGDTAMARLLIKHGADITLASQWHDNQNALERAVTAGNLDIVKLLVVALASSGKTALISTRAIYLAAETGGEEIFDLLRKSGIGEQAFGPVGRNELLVHAAAGGMMGLATQLISQGANVNTLAKDETPLTAAAGRGRLEMVKMLLEKGARPNKQNCPDNPLCKPTIVAAACHGNVEILRILLDHGASSNEYYINGGPPLLCAVKNDNVEAARILLESGAMVDTQRYDLVTPLMIAAQQENKEIVDLLISHGASVDLMDQHCRIAADYVSRSKDPAIIDALTRGQGAPSRIINSEAEDWSPLRRINISLSFRDTDAMNILNIISAVARIPVYMEKKVNPPLSIRMKNRPLIEALEMTLDRTGLGAVINNGKIYVFSRISKSYPYYKNAADPQSCALDLRPDDYERVSKKRQH